MRHVQYRLVSKILNFFEKKRPVEAIEEMLSISDNDLQNIITGNETWIYACDIETVQQSTEYRFKGERYSIFLLFNFGLI